MLKRCFIRFAAGAVVLLVVTGCVGVHVPAANVQLEVVGPPIDPEQTASPEIYRVPPAGDAPDGGNSAQKWAMLGREDRAAATASGSAEYAPTRCEAMPGSPSGWDSVVDAIAARAADHRVVIINESHHVTRHRETTRRLLAKLRPLGFSVLAAEAFFHGPNGLSPIEQQPPPWPRLNDGHYSREPAFGRLVREAKALGYRLAAYEEIYDPSAPEPADPAESVARRETAQARHLAEILRRMRPDERLVVHAGYSHASEVPISFHGQEMEWMASRLKVTTGMDPLTITQTECRQAVGPALFAQPPAGLKPGQFDMILAHPVEEFVDGRPRGRREADDIPTAIPPSLRPTDEPLVVEAFAWDEPFEAVPVDRLFVEPDEDLPLLLPPGRYRVRAVRLAEP